MAVQKLPGYFSFCFFFKESSLSRQVFRNEMIQQNRSVVILASFIINDFNELLRKSLF